MSYLRPVTLTSLPAAKQLINYMTGSQTEKGNLPLKIVVSEQS